MTLTKVPEGCSSFTATVTLSFSAIHLSLSPINSGFCQKPASLPLIITAHINKDDGASEKKMCFGTEGTIPPTQDGALAFRFHQH